MAPEQARGGSGVDHRADLYALGVVAYEALAGAHPFGTRAAQALVAAHLDELPVPLATRRPDAPPALCAVVMRMLEKDPAARPQSAADVLAALDASGSTTDETRHRGLRWSVNWRAPRVVGIAVALLAVLVASAMLTLHEREANRTEARPIVDARQVAIRAVAVLPFVNTGGIASDDYFSDGLTDELVHALARLPGLRLAGRTSRYAFKGKSLPAQQIGAALGVGALVDGTVRRAGDRLRVTAQLVSTADGSVLWDSVYESRSHDVFAVQDELTRAIVAALAPTLGGHGRIVTAPDASRGTTDEEAYELYLEGRYYWGRRGAGNITRSIAYFRQAIARDTAFARAYAGLAMAYSTLPNYVPTVADSVIRLTETNAARAVALDSTLADAQLALGIALDMRLRFRDALARYRVAVTLDPSSVTGHHWLGMSLLNLGRTEEALAELRHATELDPLAPTPAGALGTALLYARRFPEAATASRRVLARDSTFAFALWTLGLAQAFGGAPDSAVHTFERGIRLHPDDSRMSVGLLVAYASAGRWREATRVRAALHRPGVGPSGWGDAAVADLVFGDREPLVRLLTSEAGQRRYIATGGIVGCNPLFDPLWADARFRAAMRSLTISVCARAEKWPFVAPAHGA
jgi:serine/threonine-protein kinase